MKLDIGLVELSGPSSEGILRVRPTAQLDDIIVRNYIDFLSLSIN